MTTTELAPTGVATVVAGTVAVATGVVYTTGAVDVGGGGGGADTTTEEGSEAQPASQAIAPTARTAIEGSATFRARAEIFVFIPGEGPPIAVLGSRRCDALTRVQYPMPSRRFAPAISDFRAQI